MNVYFKIVKMINFVILILPQFKNFLKTSWASRPLLMVSFLSLHLPHSP